MNNLYNLVYFKICINFSQISFFLSIICISFCFVFCSVHDLLQSRRENPEKILESLGFGRRVNTEYQRIPDRFFRFKSAANGISVEKFLDDNPTLKEYWEEKNARENPLEIVFNKSGQEQHLMYFRLFGGIVLDKEGNYFVQVQHAPNKFRKRKSSVETVFD